MGSDRCMVEGIKEVRCDVCGLEIERGEIILKNGRSYHSRCVKVLMEQEKESRRNALKVIGIGTAIAGATFLGADRLASASFNRPIGGGGVYSSPFILPGLFSDPPHPEPGQVWYRMDKGVTAFHDGIINRNIYSNRNQHVITVSPKGIANGLSTIPNDGADFGPDTTLGATSPGQTGAPYTETTGIQEAWNYAFASATTNFPNQDNIKPGAYWMKPILLLEGIFILNQQVVLDPQVPITNIKMIGSGMMSTYVYWNFNDHAIIINPSNTNILGQAIEIGYMQPQPGGNVIGNMGFFATLYTSSDPGYQSNEFQSYDMVLASGNAYVFYLLGMQRIIFYNLQAFNSGANSGGFHIENSGGSVYAIGCPHMSSSYLNGARELYIIGGNVGNLLTIGNVGYVYIDKFDIYSGIQLLSNIPYIHVDTVTAGYPYPFISSSGSTAFTVDHLKIGELIYDGSQGYITPFTSSTSPANVNLLEIGKYTYAGVNGGGISGVWAFTPTTPSVPASGTATVNVNPYSVTVYLNGGSVTQIIVTRNGTGYMLFNSVVGISMSGQGFKLGPGDTITLIYGTPPTWVWMI